MRFIRHVVLFFFKVFFQHMHKDNRYKWVFLKIIYSVFAQQWLFLYQNKIKLLCYVMLPFWHIAGDKVSKLGFKAHLKYFFVNQ